MRPRFGLFLAALIGVAIVLDGTAALARGGADAAVAADVVVEAVVVVAVRHGGGSFSRGGGGSYGGGGSVSRGSYGRESSYSRGGGSSAERSGSSLSGGGSDFSRSSGGGNFSSSYFSGGDLSSSAGASRPSGGRVPSSGSQRPSAGTRPPAAERPSCPRAIGHQSSERWKRNSPLATTVPWNQAVPGNAETRPGNKPSQLPAKGSGNFLGAAAGVGAGPRWAAQLPIARASSRQIGGVLVRDPLALNSVRTGVIARKIVTTNGASGSITAAKPGPSGANNARTGVTSSKTIAISVGIICKARRDDRQEWRDQRREDWQQHREDLWDYRADRADEIWDNAQDFYDDVFDDAWWGHAGWGGYWPGYYPLDPWWWWGTATWNSVATYASMPPEPSTSIMG